MADDLLRDLERLGASWRAASAPISATELEAMPAPALELDVETRPDPPKRGRATWAVAAAAVLAAAAGLVVTSRRSPSTGGDHPSTTVTTVNAGTTTSPAGPTTTGAAPATTAPATTAPTATTSTVPLGSYRGWFFPADTPAGLRLTRLSAATTPTSDPPPRYWLRRTTDGTPDALVALSIGAPAPGERGETATDVTVHGQPGVAYDSGQGMVVTWDEGGRPAVLNGIGIDLATTIALAEALQAGPDADPVAWTLPATSGFELVPRPEVATDAVTLEAEWSVGADLSAASYRVVPNASGFTPEVLMAAGRLAPGGVAMTIESADGGDLVVAELPGPRTSVSWSRDGLVMNLTASLPREQVVAWARSVAAVDPAELQRRGEAISADAAALETFDEATFADGIRLTVKADAGVPAVLCIDGPLTRCRRQSGASLLLEVDVGARRLVVGWTSLAGQPVVMTTGGDGFGSTADMPLVDRVPTDRGQFFVSPVPPDRIVSEVMVGQTIVGGVMPRREGELFSY